MSFWLLLTLALTVQEGLSTIALLLRAAQLHYSIWIISAIWLAVTVIQIIAGYYLGKWIRKRFARSKFETWVEKQAHKLERSIDKKGEMLGIAVLSSVISPAIAAFLGAWLNISFVSIFFFSLLGDLFWYASSWAYALGAITLLSRVKEGLLILIAIAIVLVVISYSTKRKVS